MHALPALRAERVSVLAHAGARVISSSRLAILARARAPRAHSMHDYVCNRQHGGSTRQPPARCCPTGEPLLAVLTS